ncbi:ACP S-malonyltransferase [Streptomyces sp. NPDC001816]|uniref:ACP S-malonyltransferase n=1 Tax=Streptomyces sp. NPDC001816 TaxID=3364612 RepID=UPI0036C0846B
MLVVVAPGQGAQIPGFLKSWLEEPAFADHIHWLSTVCGIDLEHYGSEADADSIRDTAIAQPLIVGTGLLGARALFSRSVGRPALIDVAAGHSLGELTVAASVGMLSEEQTMVLVRERGRAMAATAAKSAAGMVAVLGGDPDDVQATIERLGLVTVNDNGPGQVVAAGARVAIARLVAEPPAATRIRPLQIAGAFHTPEVEHVAVRLGRCARAITPLTPPARLLSNLDGEVVTDGREMLDRIVRQVSLPVRWGLCMETMKRLGVTGLLELPPASTLTRIARRALPGIEAFALNTPDQLDDARVFVDKHNTAPGPA